MKPGLVTWAIVLAYLIFVFAKGLAKAKKVKGVDDFLVAGRNVGWFFLFCTMGATVIGGGASVGAIGRTAGGVKSANSLRGRGAGSGPPFRNVQDVAIYGHVLSGAS